MQRLYTRAVKKIIKAGDVIISRLRPYLKQVAFVDKVLCEHYDSVLCSTEYFVLRSKDQHISIAFIVPVLLSREVQNMLISSQEGGHHPRF